MSHKNLTAEEHAKWTAAVNEGPRVYRSIINHQQLCVQIMALENMIENQSQILAQLPHDHPEFYPNKNGLDSAKEFLQLMIDMRDDPDHQNVTMYGLTI